MKATNRSKESISESANSTFIGNISLMKGQEKQCAQPLNVKMVYCKYIIA